MICGCGFLNSRQNFEPAIARLKLRFPNQHTIITVPEGPMSHALEAKSVTKENQIVGAFISLYFLSNMLQA